MHSASENKNAFSSCSLPHIFCSGTIDGFLTYNMLLMLFINHTKDDVTVFDTQQTLKIQLPTVSKALYNKSAQITGRLATAAAVEPCQSKACSVADVCTKNEMAEQPSLYSAGNPAQIITQNTSSSLT